MAHLSVAAEPQYFRGASLQSKVLGIGLRRAVRPVLGVWAHLPIEVIPPNLVEHAAKLLPVHPGTMWRMVDHFPARSEWLQAKGVGDLGHGNEQAILYFHGGAFLTCGINTHRRLVSRISYAAEQPVLSVDYRQMPTATIAESISDGVDGFAWLLAQGYRAENITIAGDSAGGYLAFSVARAVIDRGWGRPAGIVAISPLLDFSPTGKAAHRNANRCQAFPAHAVARLTYLIDRLEQRRGVAGQRIDPVDMHLDDLPPVLIHVGSREFLMADAELMANRLVAAGVPCDLHVWEKQVHVFHAAASWVPEARLAINEIGTFIQALATRTAATAPRRRAARPQTPTVTAAVL